VDGKRWGRGGEESGEKVGVERGVCGMVEREREDEWGGEGRCGRRGREEEGREECWMTTRRHQPSLLQNQISKVTLRERKWPKADWRNDGRHLQTALRTTVNPPQPLPPLIILNPPPISLRISSTNPNKVQEVS
jgi:hypothetical protein